MRRPGSIQGRLLALVIAAVAAVWLVSALLIWRDAEDELDELLDSHLAQAAALLVAQQAGELEDDDDHLVDAPQLHRYASKVAFQVWHEGRLAMRSANAPREPMARHSKGFETLELDGRRWRIFAARGAERDVTVYVGERLDSRGSILRGLLSGLLGPMLLALPLLALLSWWAVRRGLAPLRALGTAIAQREPQALQPLAAEGAPAELAPLVGELNRLFERVGALLAAERRFTADAAHELRTPIAAIRAQAQVALGAAGDEATRSHALRATLAGCDRAAHLVEQLLTLSRLEADGNAPSGRADLALIAREVLATLAPAALARGQQLELDAPDHCPLPGSAPLLAALLRNLADNALRYSPDGARVQVRVEPAAGGMRLRVEDSGPGLTEAERVRLGERFFRVLGSGASGSGLGWSIVRRIAEVHGASITTARSERLGGLAVELRFPA